MSSELSISEDVEDFVKDIITKNKLEQTSNIKYEAGSQAGDGYSSKTFAVDITSGKDSLHLFLKCVLNLKAMDLIPIDKMYTNEIYFYDVLYPAYLKFIEERGVEDGFHHVPKCYGTSTKGMIALDNLRYKGYTLFDRRMIMNDNHIVLALKTYAKFHAVSFAYKDQKREEYDKLAANAYDFWSNAVHAAPIFLQMTESLVAGFMAKLDPVEDKHILDKCDGLALKLHEAMTSMQKSLNEYSIITQGDSWCNNIMFLYKEKDRSNPIDIRVIDWQVIRPASLVFDISYFFYTIASQEALDNLQHYLIVYHEELSKQIRALGSDPEILYPFKILESEWKQHCRFGFAVAFNMIRMMLSAKDEVVNTEEVDFENFEKMEKMFSKIKGEDEYIERMKAITNHMLKNDYI